MRRQLAKTLGIYGCLLLGLLAGTEMAAATTTWGNNLATGGNVDTCVGCDFFLNIAATPGDTLLSWVLYSDSAGQSITPFLVDISTDIVTGIGTTRVNAGGLQGFSFGLALGTDVIGANTRFAWHDGSLSALNTGTIDFSLTPGGPSPGTAGFWTSTDGFGFGNNLGTPANSDSGRYYSVQFTTDTPATSGVPEPSSLAMAIACLAFLPVRIAAKYYALSPAKRRRSQA